VIRSTRLHLSETGDPALDTLTVEHNGMLSERGLESEVVRGTLAGLADGRDPWDEIHVAGVEVDEAPLYVSAGTEAGLVTAVDWEKPYFFADLAKVRDAGGDLLATVSGNTRYQVRRALRDYAGDGEVRLVAAGSTEDALEQFARLRELHQRTWAARGQPGAFASAFAVDFHERLIRKAFPRGRVEMLRLDAGDRPIGYLYNFVHDGTASNYQSGLAYEDDAKRKPGLVAHYLAVQRCVEAGLRRYDFLMGDRRYKRSLATDEGSMAWITAQRPRLRFRAESALRALKRRAARDGTD
jgi:CelD/BcsL family acetyltransferase involved in cellulose biosynthesis